VQRTCKKFQKTNFLLAGFSFILVIYCTFLTRSGVLGDFSVHSFTDLGITGWLVFYMLAFIIIFLWLFITRLKEMHASSEKQQSAWFSRESGFICAIIALCLCTFITGLGTSAPLITRIFEKASKVSTDFYVTTNLPLAIFILFLLSFVPILSWEKNAYPKIFPNLILALTGALVAGIITLANGYTGYGILFLSLCAGATVSINLFLIMKFLPKKITFCSGHIAHFGLGLMFLGIISSSLYDTSQKLILKQGAANKALNSEIKLNNIQIEKHGKGTSVQFLLDIKQQDSNFPAKPDIYIETQESGRTQRFVHPYIRRGLINDLYISPIDFDIGQEKGSKNHIDLKQSEKIQLYDYELTFTGFEVSGMQNGKNISVGAHIEVSYKGERRVTLKPVISMDSRHSPKSRVKLPGTENDYITLTGINASSKTIHLDYEIAQHTAHQKNQSQVPSLLAEISIKPGMTLLWAGTFFMLLGGGIGIVRRMR